jgi:SulP family sulfate permease
MCWRHLPLRSWRCRCRWRSPSPRAFRPSEGLYAAVIGGFLVSALGGSRYQIGGPAGAFIVLVAATVTKFGLDGLLADRLPLRIHADPDRPAAAWFAHSLHSPCVTVGFTCGIAVTIFASQLKDLGGLKLPGAEPGQLLPKLAMLGQALPTISLAALRLAWARPL